MFRKRVSLLLFSVFAGAAAATLASEPPEVSWLDDVQKGMAEAEKQSLPMLFYLDAADADEEVPDDAQEKSLIAPQVRTVIDERFVPIRLLESTMTKVLLEQMKATDAALFSVVAATPQGRLIQTIPPRQVARPDELASLLTAVFREYGKNLFESDLKAKLEDEDTRASEVAKSLRLIEKFMVNEADASIIALLKREGLADPVKAQGYDTLAALSTPKGAEALLSAALHGEAAKTALAKCTPDAAEALVAALDPEKPDELRVVCSAVSRICGIPDCDPGLFAPDADLEARKKEIERLKSAATECAKASQAKSQGAPEGK
jgi:hypothetical protein